MRWARLPRAVKLGLWSIALGLPFWATMLILKYWLIGSCPGNYDLFLAALWVTCCVVLPTYVATLAGGVLAIVAVSNGKDNLFLGYAGLVLSSSASVYFWYHVFLLLRSS